jgi:hypothetical protein
MSRFKPGVDVKRGSAPDLAAGRPARAAWGVPLVVGALLSSCGALVGNDAEIGGETHFLVTCEAGCGPGLSCIDGVCTQRCEPDDFTCSGLGSQAQCVPVPEDTRGASPLSGTCDVQCVGDTDCTALGTGFTCRTGACRGQPDANEVLSMGAPLVRTVEPDSCRSSLLWVGDDRPSAEMRPGSDCVGCHRETGALPLIIGGTVASVGGLSSARAPEPEPDGCFGVEGVEVSVVDATGREWRTVTNRAGNFYFEGTESDLSLPYAASIRWKNFQGDELLTPMSTSPSYGGCARCHSPAVVEPVPPYEAWPEPDEVIPRGPVYPPGLYDN